MRRLIQTVQGVFNLVRECAVVRNCRADLHDFAFDMPQSFSDLHLYLKDTTEFKKRNVCFRIFPSMPRPL